MFAAKIVSLLGVTASAVDFEKLVATEHAGDDASNYCLDGTTFCQRTREFKLDQNSA